MIGLSYKQKCNNFGYHLKEVQSKGNDNQGGDILAGFENKDFFLVILKDFQFL